MRRARPPAQDALEAAREVGRALARVLSDDLLAVYLHGSAVLGGFDWNRSDLDILALSSRALSDDQFRRVVHELGVLAYPANGLEFSLMVIGEACPPELPAPHFQLHQSTDGLHGAGMVVDGRTRTGDPDLVMHMAVCREHGVAIVGPPPATVIAPFANGAVRSAMCAEILWAREHAASEYLVLTAARVWFFLETHRLVSKVEAGEWAADHYAEPDVLVTALARHRGTASEIDGRAAARLADHVERLAARSGRG